MKRPDIDAIKARIGNATPGPWKACKAKEAFENWPVCPSLGEDFDGVEWGVSTDGVHASEMDRGDAGTDAQFIAASRQDIPDLIAYIEHLEARLEDKEPTCKPSLQVEGAPAAILATDAIPGYTSETEDLTTWPETRGKEWRRMASDEILRRGDVIGEGFITLGYDWVRMMAGTPVSGLRYSFAWTRRPPQTGEDG